MLKTTTTPRLEDLFSPDLVAAVRGLSAAAQQRIESALQVLAHEDGVGGCRSPRRPVPPVTAVRRRPGGHDVGDAWYGSADALVAAGLARVDELPGQPGRPKLSVAYRPAAGKQGARCWDRAPGYRCITRVGDGFRIDVTASIEEQERRAGAAHARAQRDREQWLAMQAQEAGAIARSRLAEAGARGARLPARPTHLRLAWSAPNTDAGA
jgi:hypothetical protein